MKKTQERMRKKLQEKKSNIVELRVFTKFKKEGGPDPRGIDRRIFDRETGDQLRFPLGRPDGLPERIKGGTRLSDVDFEPEN